MKKDYRERLDTAKYADMPVVAIWLSVEHWLELWEKASSQPNAYFSTSEYTESSCPLCYLYANTYTCKGCPVADEIQKPDCVDTPWEEVHKAIEINRGFNSPMVVNAIEAEYLFLVKLAIKITKNIFLHMKEQTMPKKTFEDLVHQAHPIQEGTAAVMNFDNGWGVSVIRSTGSHGYPEFYELAVLKNLELHYKNSVAQGDVRGYLTPEEITKLMAEVQDYES